MLTPTKDELSDAIKLSSMLELDDTKTKLRRIGNKPLPELKLLNKKRKADNANDDEGEKGEDEEAKSFDP